MRFHETEIRTPDRHWLFVRCYESRFLESAPPAARC